MIKLYSSYSSSSSNKARQWLINHRLEFIEIRIGSHLLKKSELQHILSLTESGTHDIISTHCIKYDNLSSDLDELSLNQLICMVNKNPSLLKRPLILDGLKLQIGFNEDQIRKFLPKDFRVVEKEIFLKRLDS